MSINQLSTEPQSELLHSNAKRFAYLLIAVLIGLILTVEDFTDEDFQVKHIFLEFLVFVPVLTLMLNLFGAFFRKSIQWLRGQSFLHEWKMREVGFIVLWGLLVSIVLFFLAFFINKNFIVDDGSNGFFDAKWGIWVMCLIFVSILIPVELFEEMLVNRRRLEMQNERLMRSHEMAKYQALMNQINPHFLFNSLNVLSYLVHKDPYDAERFIDELSKIYRYILQLNEAYIVPLKKEVEFIESYIFLQKIRFQDNLIFESEIDATALQKLIPPLTLELLVENAIKHNVISEKHPLLIQLSTQNGHLIVKNNLQPRMESEVISNQVGLKNLLEKFEILETAAPEFYTKNNSFVAKIPLMKPEIT